MLGKTILNFDSADLAKSDQVGAHLFSQGTELTNTGGALDVNITNGLTVNIDGIYDSGTNATPDSVGLVGNTRAATPAIAGQVERMTVGVPADGLVNANIHGLDTNGLMYGFNGTTWDRIKATSGAMDVNIGAAFVADDAVDAGGSLKVGSRALSGALAAISASGDRADLVSDMYRRLRVNNSAQIGGAITKPAVVDNASVQVTRLAGSTRVLIQNLSNKEIALGFVTGVTMATGIVIEKNGFFNEELGEAVPLYIIGQTGITADVRVLQVG
jgi:hypothetical protein